jgi:PAS domain-containing protein
MHKTRSVDVDEGKKAEDRLRRSEAYLAEAQRLSHTGSAVYTDTELLHWSDEAARLFGFDPLLGIPSREAVWQRIHPDDLDRVNETIAILKTFPVFLNFSRKGWPPGFPSTSNYACGASTANIGGLITAPDRFAMTPGASRAGTIY